MREVSETGDDFIFDGGRRESCRRLDVNESGAPPHPIDYRSTFYLQRFNRQTAHYIVLFNYVLKSGHAFTCAEIYIYTGASMDS